MKNTSILWVMPAALLTLLASIPAARAADNSPQVQGDRIEDNSFFLEEAYNQERGVVQLIQGVQAQKLNAMTAYTLTNEIPITDETHQFSYTIPITHFGEDQSRTGLGDILINYRYQLSRSEKAVVTPRISLVVPTGNYERGFGSGAFGFQTNTALSLELSSSWVNHWNLGATYIPGAKDTDGSRVGSLGFNFGTSFIYLARPTLNLLVEIFGTTSAPIESAAGSPRTHTFYVSPGARYAFNLEGGLQVVPGVGFPIGIGPSSGDYGIFTYLSLEQKLW